jgi:co-chaperonin GroES (HSP10)
MKIKPLFDRVLIKEGGKQETTSGGIFIGNLADEGQKSGEVVDIGKAVTLVKSGDVVFFQFGDEITADGTKYFLVQEVNILAKKN